MWHTVKVCLILISSGCINYYCANKIHDLISVRKFVFWDFFIMYLNVASDNLYQKWLAQITSSLWTYTPHRYRASLTYQWIISTLSQQF